MTCKCLGVSVDTCGCARRGTRATEFTTAIPQGHRRFAMDRRAKFRSPVTKLVENLYDTCAAYNIRHCPFQEASRKGSLRSAICDVCVLACFLIANSVVFLTIMARAIMHTSSAVISIAKWAVGKVKFESNPPEPTPMCFSAPQDQFNQVVSSS